MGPVRAGEGPAAADIVAMRPLGAYVEVGAWEAIDRIRQGGTPVTGMRGILAAINAGTVDRGCEGPRSGETLVTFVPSLNLHRRYLDDAQRALVAARAKQEFEAEALHSYEDVKRVVTEGAIAKAQVGKSLRMRRGGSSQRFKLV